MKNKGIIESKKGEDVTIKVFKDTACSHCSGCSEGSKFSTEYSFKCNEKELNVGDTVNFEIDDTKLLKISFLIYILPVILLFSMYYLASFLTKVEGIKILSAFTGIIIYFILIFFIDKKLGHDFLNKHIKINKGDI